MSAIQRLVEELEKKKGQPPPLADEPGVVFRTWFDEWIEQGGYVRGKPRNAVRNIKNWLGKEQVPSLETKLAGKTRLKHKDAAILIRLFLKRWRYDEAAQDHIPYSAGDLEKLVDQLLELLFPESQTSIFLPLRSRTGSTRTSQQSIGTQTSTLHAALKPSGKTIRKLFAQSDALVTISRARTIIGNDPARMMTGFQALMDDLYEIDQQDSRKRALIWVVDIGVRYENDPARLALYNIHFLGAQFRTLAVLNASERRERWDWISKTACVLVGSLKHSEIDRIYATAERKVDIAPQIPDLVWSQGDRISLEAVPGRWLDANGIEAFGKTAGTIWRIPTVTAHLRIENWDEPSHLEENEQLANLRYFYHGSIDSSLGNERLQVPHCVPLPQPGHGWSNGFRLACTAAFSRLGRNFDRRLRSAKPRDALAQLRSQHFAVLRLNEFLRLPDLLIEMFED